MPPEYWASRDLFSFSVDESDGSNIGLYFLYQIHLFREFQKVKGKPHAVPAVCGFSYLPAPLRCSLS